MIVHVRLHTTLQQVRADGRAGSLALELPGGACVRDALALLDIVANDDALLLVLNRRRVEADVRLEEGDRLDLIPAIDGG